MDNKIIAILDMLGELNKEQLKSIINNIESMIENIEEEENEEKEGLLQETISLYDEYLQETEKRGVSYGELAYLQGLTLESLQELKNELEREIPLF